MATKSDPRNGKPLHPGTLSARLLAYVVIVSTALSICTAIIQLFVEYRIDIGEIEDTFSIIQETYVPAIASSHFFLDTGQTNILLEGITLLPDIDYVELDDDSATDSGPVYTMGSKTARNHSHRSFDLLYSYDGTERQVGTLQVYASLSNIADRTCSRAVTLLATNTAAILIVSLSILLMLDFFVIRHLRTISREVRSISFSQKESRTISLSRPHQNKRDELDDIVDAVNKMQFRMRESFDHLKKSEHELENSVHEKETLLRELYHRTKNNMQVINSLLTLQSSQLSDNFTIQKMVTDTQNRINAMSLVHKMLYQSQDLSHITMPDYCETLCRNVINSYGRTETVHLNCNIEDIRITLDSAIPLGLILNELLANSLTHAFSRRESGIISISMQITEGNEIRLVYRDNGIAPENGFDFRTQQTLGLSLIYLIGEEQLRGHVDFSVQDGVVCTITVPGSRILE